MDVTIIGAGNIAWHLAPALDNCGYAVRNVYNRSQSSGKQLVSRLYDANLLSTLDFSDLHSSIFILCIADDAISEVVSEVVLPEDALLIHTSGSKPLEILENAAAYQTGVFYPLQSFSKTRKVDFQQIPILVEGSDSESASLLKKMASSLTQTVKIASSEKRKAIHLAAVFASNFANHMLTASNLVLEKNDLDFNLLKPLIIETINKALELGPEKALTGPARREDFQTLDAHIDMLDDELKTLYQTVTQHILDHYA